MTLARSARNLGKRERDAAIRARLKTRSRAEVAEEFGLSQPRISQIAAQAADLDEVAALEERLQAELDELVTNHERNRRRIAVVRHSLDRIAEERQAAEIDRLLGLA